MIVELLYDTVEVNASWGSRPCAHDSPFAERWKVPLCCLQGSEPLPLCSSFDLGLSSTVGQVSNPHCSFLKRRSQTSSGQMPCFSMCCVCVVRGACWQQWAETKSIFTQSTWRWPQDQTMLYSLYNHSVYVVQWGMWVIIVFFSFF